MQRPRADERRAKRQTRRELESRGVHRVSEEARIVVATGIPGGPYWTTHDYSGQNDCYRLPTGR